MTLKASDSIDVGRVALRPNSPPIVVLGVSRSGTTLLMHMLNQHSEIAIPGEAYFMVPLWERYRGSLNAKALLSDLSYIWKIQRWGIDLDAISQHMPPEAGFSEIMQTLYHRYAEVRGKSLYGDKTPQHIQYLELLEHVFPEARYVHIVRDGRNAALSYERMARRPRFSWMFPQGLGDFAARWRREIVGAQHFGGSTATGRYFELRYEDLVKTPEVKLREITSFLGLRFEPAMLLYHQKSNPTRLSNHRRLAEPPSEGGTDWRTQMGRADIERFEAIAGDLLETLGYERAIPRPSSYARIRGILSRTDSRARVAFMRLTMPLVWRSPAWRLRQAAIRRGRRLTASSSSR